VGQNPEVLVTAAPNEASRWTRVSQCCGLYLNTLPAPCCRWRVNA